MKASVSYIQAIGYAILGFTFWVLCDASMKLAGQAKVPPYQIVFLTSLISVAFLLIPAMWRKRLASLRPNKIKLEVFRSIIRLINVYANVYAFTHLPLTTVYTVLFMGPMLISIQASIFMGERLSWQQIAAILVGFAGVIIALNPATINFGDGNILGYIALPFCLLSFSAGMFMIRLMSKTETDESMVFFPQAFLALATLPLCLWHYEPLTLEQYAYITALAGFANLGWICMNVAFRHAPAAIVSPFHYSQIITGAIVGYLIWHDMPTLSLMVGAVVIVASGLYIGYAARARTCPA